MSPMYVAPSDIDQLLTTAAADLQAANQRDGKCACVYDRGQVGEFCWPHRVLGLLVPSVEAHELPWKAATA